MSKQLHELIESVVDEETFVAFLLAMSEDYSLTGSIDSSLGWQSNSIDTLLESAAAWATDTHSSAYPSQNPWRRCAEIMWAGKHYE